jgi:glycosyltransferase involved in cell wall biosynthesis
MSLGRCPLCQEGRALQNRMIKLLHIITGLNTGGAEMMLYKLLTTLDRGRFGSAVVSLSDYGSVGQRISELGIPVSALGLSPSVPHPKPTLSLLNHIRVEKPGIVQTWMYHSDLLGGVAAKICGAIPVVWNLQNSTLDPLRSRTSTRWVVRACARFSNSIPDRIVCCSDAVREIHAGLGYARKPMTVIPNGVDPTVFSPDRAARISVRQELGLTTEAVLIGMVARFDPQKDHGTFLKAAAVIAARHPEVQFLLCGSGVDRTNDRLIGWAQNFGIEHRCHLLGLRHDLPRLTAALDIAVLSSSYGEGLANVILEAMSCAVPSVVTSVGGNPDLVADTGRTVPRENPDALASALRELIESGAEARARLGFAARERIQCRFSLSAIVKDYERLYEQLVFKGSAQEPGVEKGLPANAPQRVRRKVWDL